MGKKKGGKGKGGGGGGGGGEGGAGDSQPSNSGSQGQQKQQPQQQQQQQQPQQQQQQQPQRQQPVMPSTPPSFAVGEHTPAERGGGGGGRGRGRGRGWGVVEAPPPERRDVPPEVQSYSPPTPGLSQAQTAPRGRGQPGLGQWVGGRGRGGGGAGGPPSFGPGGDMPQAQPQQRTQQQQQHQQPRPPPPQQQQPPAHSHSPSSGSLLPAVEAISQKTSRMTVAKWRIPERKHNGTKGRPIPLELNHFELTFRNQNFSAIHYDVSFKPDKPRRMFRPIMEAFRRRFFPNNYPAFDGRKNLYSAKELPFGMEITNTVNVFNDERYCEVEYEVTVKFASRVDMSQLFKYLSSKGQSNETPQEALQAIDIVLRNPAALSFVNVGRSFFSSPERIVDLGEGLELWYGFYQSAILGWKPFLNVDVAHKGFPIGEKLLESLCRIGNINYNALGTMRGLDSGVEKEFERYIKGLKVEYQIPNRPDTKRIYKVNKLVKSAVQQRFILEKDNKKVEMTVGEYFEREKRCRLQLPFLPLVHIGPLNKEFFVPLEMCTIVRGQAINRKLTPDQTGNMVRNAAKPPDERRKKIADALRKANFNHDKCVQEFGIHVSDRFAEVNGRVLAPPTLEYNRQTITPTKGVWRSGRFFKAVEIGRWAIINCDRRTNDSKLMSFGNDMMKQGHTLGINIIDKPKIISFFQVSPFKPQWRPQFSELLSNLRRDNVEIVIVVIPDQGELYAMVKQVAELTVGVLTQCIKAKTMFKMNPATVGNILLKVNSKLNGINHRIGGRPKLLERPCMIMGADVTHPSPDQTNIPSVAAVSASHDANGFMYNMLWRLQPSKTEIIEDLQAIVVEQLKLFKQRSNLKPERIYFFRDGVSEGQFNQVLSAELTAIRQACRTLNENYQPGITFLVVQKRHHTRFFPKNAADKDGKWGNVPAGTIVDTLITHKRETDFYLVSHASIQGTARPTKYHLLWDDNNIDEDDLEELTYSLCHLFTRCTRSVSYPAPTYYAHLAAFRARVYLEGQHNFPNLKREMENRKIEVNFQKENPMFFV